MERQFRLRKGGDFKLVRNEGRSWAHPLLVLYARPSGLDRVRVGISVSRRIGNSVTRNRVKRLIREAARLRLPEANLGWDLLIIARPPAAKSSFAAVSTAIGQLLERSHLLIGPPARDRTFRRATIVVEKEISPPPAGGLESLA